MATEVDRLIVTLEARLDRYNADLARGQAVTNQRLSAMEARYAQFGRGVQSSVGGIGLALGTLGTYLSAEQLVGYADAWVRVERATASAAETFGIVTLPAKRLNELASDARINVEAYTVLYTRAAAAIRDYGFAAGTAETVTSTLSKALKLGSADAAEQASVLRQFSQALNKGKLDGQEFIAVMENAPVVQELLANRLKVSKGELIKLAADGKLRIKDLIGAMTDGAKEVERLFRAAPQTSQEAFAVLNNAIAEYVGKLDKTYGITSSVVGVTAALARNIETVGDAALVLGAGLSAAFAPKIVAAVIGVSAAVLAAAGPIGLIIGAIAGASAAIGIFGDKLKVTADGAVSLKDAAKGLAEAMTDGAQSTRGFESTMHGFGVELESTGGKVESFTEKAERLARAAAIMPKLAGFSKGLKSFLDGTLKDPVKLKKGPTPNDTADAKKNSFEREIESIKKKTDALIADAKVVGQSAAVQEKARATQELLTAARRAELELTPARLKAIDDLASAYAKAASEIAFLNALQASKDEGEAIKRELDLIGLTGIELHRARIAQELYNEAKKAGRVLSKDDEADIARIASRNAALIQTREIMREIEDQSKDALKGFISDMQQGKSAAEAFGNVLNKIADKLIDMAVNDLVGSAMGGFKAAGGEASLLKLFGFANGGVIVPGSGPQQLQRFAKGGVSSRAAIFGEAGPEAAVPLPDGRRIPVDLRMPSVPSPAASVAPNVTVQATFNVQNGTTEGVDKLKAEIVPLMRQVAQSEIVGTLDRRARFAKLKG